MTFADKTIRDLLAAFRSPEPTPGGGSAAALGGAVGAALLAMVAGLGRSRATAAEDVERLAAAGRACAQASEHLTVLIDRDSAAYDAVMAAYKLPKGTDDEKRSRSAAIQLALAAATATPLDVMRRCGAAIREAETIAEFGNRNASSDVEVGLELLMAGLRGAAVNVETNLLGLEDTQRAGEIRTEVMRLAQAARDGLSTARARLATDD